jgi:hypothetical protein
MRAKRRTEVTIEFEEIVVIRSRRPGPRQDAVSKLQSPPPPPLDLELKQTSRSQLLRGKRKRAVST